MRLKTLHLLCVVGARPQFIKLAPLVSALKDRSDIKLTVVHTGQHYDYSLSDVFFQQLQLPAPDHNLEVGSHTPATQMALIMMRLETILQQEKPDMVIVFGDTNSTAAAAICAAKNNIAIAHIEAGLREWNKHIPEEVNKLLTDAVTDLYFAPTQTGLDNLQRAGVTKNAFHVGDIGIDLVQKNILRIVGEREEVFEVFNIREKNYYLATCHRAANTDDASKLKCIFTALAQLELPTIFPMHPRTRAVAMETGLYSILENTNVQITEPLGFFETQTLIRYAKMCISDSGGVIKEAYFHRTPCAIIDAQSEWLETISEGWNVVVGTDVAQILAAVQQHQTPETPPLALGNGTAATQIVAHIEAFLRSKPAM